MSTYESEHDVRDAQSSTDASGNANAGATTEGRHQPSLSQSIESFLNIPREGRPTVDTERLVAGLRQTLGQGELTPEQIDQFVGSLSANNTMISDLVQSINPNDGFQNKGLDDSFMDTLERVPIKSVKKDETCPICTSDYHSDPYPLIVRLPCNKKHYFDLDCIAPWLKLNRTCPLCRVDVTVQKPLDIGIPDDDEEIEEGWDMYG